MNLATTERLALQYLHEAEQALQQTPRYFVPSARRQLQADGREVLRAVEDRLKLKRGSIGKTHEVNMDTGKVVPK